MFVSMQNPQKFHKPPAQHGCISCGQDKCDKHIRFIHDLKGKSHMELIKEMLLIQMPAAGNERICDLCISKMQKV